MRGVDLSAAGESMNPACARPKAGRGFRRIGVTLLCALVVLWLSPQAPGSDAVWPAKTQYHFREVAGRRIFYREAGDPTRPTVLLLHGYPSSSHEYRELIPLLSGRYHVIAPDNLGSGFSDHPDPAEVHYTFDLLSEVTAGLLTSLGVDHCVIYMQDFGAPVGFRLALRSPALLDGLIVQNANAYLEGLTDARRAFFTSAHEDQSAAELQKLYDFVSRDSIVNRQYLRDIAADARGNLSPDSWSYDLQFLQSDSDRQIQVQLFQDYYSNLLAYPHWQAFLRERRPPTLIVWGRRDAAFISPGAEAYLKDVPKAELHLLDAGHFAVEEQPVQIAQYIVTFMDSLYDSSGRVLRKH